MSDNYGQDLIAPSDDSTSGVEGEHFALVDTHEDWNDTGPCNKKPHEWTGNVQILCQFPRMYGSQKQASRYVERLLDSAYEAKGYTVHIYHDWVNLGSTLAAEGANSCAPAALSPPGDGATPATTDTSVGHYYWGAVASPVKSSKADAHSYVTMYCPEMDGWADRVDVEKGS